MIEYEVEAIASKLRVEGDRIALLQRPPLPLPQDWIEVRSHTLEYPSHTPFYNDFEGFCRWVGDDIRVAPASLDIGDRIIYIYDYRPPFYPLISDIADPITRGKERSAAKYDPGLYGPNGEMLEWGAGGNYGYAWNLDTDYFSEWGTAPFPHAGETEEQMVDRHQSGLRAFVEAMGETLDSVTHIQGPQVVAATYATDKRPAE
jgi:hypothetical protein